MSYARGEDRSLALKKLSKNYQKIIEYFSARASSYYLIYVNKLNNLFSENKELGKWAHPFMIWNPSLYDLIMQADGN